MSLEPNTVALEPLSGNVPNRVFAMKSEQPLVPPQLSEATESAFPGTAACVVQHFRCPEQFVRVRVPSPSADGSPPGFFRFGPETICFGHLHGHAVSPTADGALPDAASEVLLHDGFACLPFDPCEVVANFHHELYVDQWRSGAASLLASLYYFVRPLMPVSLRRHLQKIHLRGWDKLSFPRWPVDCSADTLLENLLLLSLQQSGADGIPFIWFWPEGHSACALMTHDVETEIGRDFCPTLMSLDESYGIPASMQVIPEKRYGVTPQFLDSLRSRGFEVVIHDLNHDGHLYRSREQFLERAAKINEYRLKFGAEGFRAAVLYRKQVWYDALQFSFDMSVPNVAHLDPQRGGCCTIMPYFLGDIVELPVTTIQDYSLFSILRDYSTSIWQKQTEIILARHGLMSFIIHPDYVMQPRERAVFDSLLQHLARLRDRENVWIALPSHVNQWWRQRAAMSLVETPFGWKIQGPGSERARLAWATRQNGRLVMTLDSGNRTDA